MIKRILAVAATFVFGAEIAAAAEYPFVGRWNCEVETFTFSNRNYHNGSTRMAFKSVEFGVPGDFQLSFADGYRISLLNVKKKTMTWHSPVSGDTLQCKRL